mmetsp:Transcript_9917/g.13869  ORF Transcript_9917/g.13869 Transcript_9917/m.13869 type:complete len:359 (-) Transcript_9917:236-1312(-)|eukprot:CAMPEP_0185731730 /NCGR_PEP_ID=MMETSP1171-20130828/13863_1 /TAXON_ID=374046 /ORGANISM="Helicotheca tamensis, Strain CCMP826" /LENGTH=358 /DNA_ID=CAMNT_0028401049 /DNA_START=118 /DNA_END=1194 /DNA_ORIENTATION=+
MARSRWADEDDDSSVEEEQKISPSVGVSGSSKTSGGVTIPPTHTSRVDSKGIKIVTSYRAHPTDPNRLLKTTTKIRVYTDKVRESVDVAKRRKWKKFGQAAVDEDTSNVTIQSRDDVFLEDPNADEDLQEEDVGKALAGNLNAFWAKQQRRQLERKYDVEADGGGGGADALAKQAAADAADGWTQVGDKSGGGGDGKYVPPSARGGGGTLGGKSLAAMAEMAPGEGGDSGGRPKRFDDRDQNTIRVTNISENTTEADLQELFQPFGRISRVYLAKDKETMQSRGFAFVSFVHRDNAARAMEKLQGFGYDHLILKLEWARPSAPKDPSAGTQFRSGYGKALAQDTKEKVSYASNLTRGM